MHVAFDTGQTCAIMQDLTRNSEQTSAGQENARVSSSNRMGARTVCAFKKMYIGSKSELK